MTQDLRVKPPTDRPVATLDSVVTPTVEEAHESHDDQNQGRCGDNPPLQLDPREIQSGRIGNDVHLREIGVDLRPRLPREKSPSGCDASVETVDRGGKNEGRNYHGHDQRPKKGYRKDMRGNSSPYGNEGSTSNVATERDSRVG